MNFTQRVGALALVIAVAPAAWAAGDKAMSQAQRQYQLERSHCMSGQSHQDRATCLKEAAAAYGEARKGAINNAGKAAYSQNATERCNAQPAADRDACIQRMGAGSTSGSVKGGGMIRETETKAQ